MIKYVLFVVLNLSPSEHIVPVVYKDLRFLDLESCLREGEKLKAELFDRRTAPRPHDWRYFYFACVKEG